VRVTTVFPGPDGDGIQRGLRAYEGGGSPYTLISADAGEIWHELGGQKAPAAPVDGTGS